MWEREIPKPDFAIHHAAKVGCKDFDHRNTWCCPTCQSPGSAIAPQSELHWHADETSGSLELVEENEGWKLNVMKFAGAECEGSERE